MKQVEGYSADMVSIRNKEKNIFGADMRVHITVKRHSRAKRGNMVDFNKEDSQCLAKCVCGEENRGSKGDNVDKKRK